MSSASPASRLTPVREAAGGGVGWRAVDPSGPEIREKRNRVALEFRNNAVCYRRRSDDGRRNHPEAGVALEWEGPPSWIYADRIRGDILKCSAGGKPAGCGDFADSQSNFGKAQVADGEVTIAISDNDADEFTVSFWVSDGSGTTALIREYTYQRDPDYAADGARRRS